MSPGAPILSRIDRLTEAWFEFTDDEAARLLLWRVHAGDRPLVNAFLAREEDETGEIPDLFLRFEVPFAPTGGYVGRLLDLLRSSSEQPPAREEGPASEQPAAQEEGSGSQQPAAPEQPAAHEEAPWICPPPASADAPPPGPHDFVHACASLIEHYNDLLEYLVVVLSPADDPDPAVWHPWLLTLLATDGFPDRLRLLVLDDRAAPDPRTLPDAELPGIRIDNLALGLPSAARQIAAEANDGSPAGEFRELLASIPEASAAGDPGAARAAADQALQFARSQQWPSMECVVHGTTAGLQLAGGEARQAIEAYRSMRAVATDMSPDDPARTALLLQGALGEAGVHFGEEAWSAASEGYYDAGLAARESDNPILEIEAWRMLGECWIRLDDLPRALDAWSLALHAGHRIEADQRPDSGLRLAAARFARHLDSEEWAPRQPHVEPTLVEFYGPDWYSELMRDTEP